MALVNNINRDLQVLPLAPHRQHPRLTTLPPNSYPTVTQAKQKKEQAKENQEEEGRVPEPDSHEKI